MSRRSTQACQPCAEHAVAAREMMVQKAEGSVGREGCKPQRQARKLHRHRADVHAEQTAFGNRPPDPRALGSPEIVRAMSPRSNERTFVTLGQIGARTD